MTTSRPRWLLTAALLIVPAVIAGGAAIAAEVEVPREDAPLEVAATLVPTAITPIVGSPDDVPGAESDLSLRLLVANDGQVDLGELRVFVEVFGAVSSRSELHAALDGRSPTTPLLVDTVADVREGQPLAPEELEPLEVRVDSQRVGWTDRGVHPVRVSLLHGREVLDETVTAVVRLPEVPHVPLRTVLGWPLHAEPLMGPGGTDALIDEIRPGGRLERLVWALERRPDARVQPLVSAHLLEDLAELDDPVADAFLDRLRETLDGSPAPVVGPYADADLAGLVAHDLPLEALQHVLESRRIAEEVLERRPVPDAMWATTPLSPATARELLNPARVRTLLLDRSQLDLDPRPPRTPATPYALTPGGGSLVALATDPWFLDLLPDRSVPPAVAVQRVLAETALIHLERPNDPERVLTLLPPPDWSPLPAVADDLLAALDSAPWLTVGGIGGALGAVPQPYPAARLHSPDIALTSALAREISGARRDVVALQDALREPGTGVGGVTWQQLDRDLLRAASASVGPEAAASVIAAVRDAVAEGVGAVELPRDSQVTLTDQDGTIPLTVARTAGPPIRVTVSLDAPPRLQFPEGTERTFTLEEGERRTIAIPTSAGATGRIPVIARAAVAGSPDSMLLAEEQVVVNSMAISVPALLSLGAMFAALLAWWLVRRIRPTAPQLEIVHDEAA